jgi:spermidine synthase
MGMVIAAMQGLLIRLLLVSFAGNELSIGLILAGWMLTEAVGSHLAGRLAPRLSQQLRSFVVLQLVFGTMVPLVVAAGYGVRRLAGVGPGEALGLVPMAWTSVLLLAPVSAIHGAMFSVGSASYPATPQDQSVVGRLYACEALGAMLGGVALTFLLVPQLNPVQIALLLALVSLATGLSLAWPRRRMQGARRWIVPGGLAAMLCLYLLLSPQALALHQALIQARWAGAFDVLYDRDSPYGNVAVTALLGQYTFLANGSPVLTTPLPDIAAVEETVHLPLLFHPDPRRVLVIGRGLGGVLGELLKYPLEAVDYAELDPVLIEAARAFPTDLTERELHDARVQVHGVDGRLFLNQWLLTVPASADRYDVVWVNLPYPSTLEINRFYTQEFFRLLRQALDSEGLVVFACPGSLSYIGPAMRDLNLMQQGGLQAVFPQVRPIPGDTTFWLASPSLPLATVGPDTLISRWEERALPTRLITAEHLRVRFDPQRLVWFERAMESQQRVVANRDLRPAGVLYGLAYWSEMFAPLTHRLLSAVSRIGLWPWCLLAVVVTALVGVAGRGRTTGIPFVVASSGLAGMVCDLMIVFVFQALHGYVYQQVGLIIAAFMAGLSLGGWLTSRVSMGGLLRAVGGRRALLLSEVALVGYWLLLPSLLSALSSLAVSGLVTLALLLLNALGGVLVGLQFPLSSRLHLSAHREPGRTAGVLYAADLAGAFLGALAVGIALLPVLGTSGTCLFVAVLKACSLVLFWRLAAGQALHIPGSG